MCYTVEIVEFEMDADGKILGVIVDEKANGNDLEMALIASEYLSEVSPQNQTVVLRSVK